MAVASNDDGKAAPAAGSASRPLVLLVKNEVLWRSQVAEALRSRGYKVIEAAHSEEARTLLRLGLKPCLLLSDLKMPGRVDGVALLNLCRTLFPGVPVLLASREPPAEPLDNVTFIAKPYSFEALFAAVGSLIGKP